MIQTPAVIPAPFASSVLIANRGEIAVRVVREAKALGLRAVAVYSDADKRALHVEEADAAVRIGPAPAAQSYLNAEAILAAAKTTGAEAIHPGYGFLAENADFAQAVIDAGLVWIGPAPQAIRAMGDKGNAKEIARKASVPVIPGYDGDDQSDARLLAEARKIGWPVLIKAALGGGGRGQRRVTVETDFADALGAAKREALSAFASDRVILEKALDNVRHVEVQVFGDAHGNVIHLGERDCSVQRRNQKIIEEAPAPGVGDDLRARMGDAAVRLAKAVDYTNAGTVEYLLDRAGHFYFLEMNTRIQVEHPVTEEVTGTNLIQWQFDVAMGKPLPLKQTDIRFEGHAIEARLCAEDPGDNFKPQLGEIDIFNRRGVDARVDQGVRSGTHITDNYDSMIAKIVARGQSREEARQELIRSLRNLDVVGLRTNRSYLIDLLRDDEFARAKATTAWLAARPSFVDQNLGSEAGRIAALDAAFGLGAGWASTGTRRTRVRLRERDSEREFVIVDGEVDGTKLVSATRPVRGNIHELVVQTAEKHLRAAVMPNENWIHVDVDRGRIVALFEDVTYAPAEPKGASGANVVRAPMAGRIVKVLSEPGAKVAKNQVLVILEAMKMEHELRAATDGVVESVTAKPGDQVAIRQTLVTLVAGSAGILPAL